MIDAIIVAVNSGEIDDLRTAIEWNELPPAFGPDRIDDPIGFLKEASADKSGRQMLAILGNMLSVGPARQPIGRDPENTGVFVWPYLAERPLDALTPAEEVDARVAALGPDSPSDILFTSGTTGRPKGAVCTHGQVVRAYAAWAEVVGLTHDDRYLVVSPFFHAFGYKAGIIAAMTVGSPIYPEPVFDVNRVMERVAAERISMLPGPPALYQSILNHPDLDTEALASLRLAVTGAASVPVELIEAMGDTLGFETVITGYGLTEACGIATMCRDGDDPVTIATTSGRAIPGVEVATFDEHGAATEPGVPGEVRIRGYNVMTGYLDDPEATAEAIDADGWLATGDIGVLNPDGYLAITDRLKDMFIVGGFNAYPAEIERQLLIHPDVAQAAVIGVPDDRLGEVGYAFVVPASGAEVDEAGLIGWCREHLANFKVPRHVESVDELPFNAGGKVMKFKLREQAAATMGSTS